MFFVNLGIVYIFLIVGMFGLVFGFFILGWYVLEILGVILFVFGVIGMGYFGYDVVGFVFMIFGVIFFIVEVLILMFGFFMIVGLVSFILGGLIMFGKGGEVYFVNSEIFFILRVIIIVIGVLLVLFFFFGMVVVIWVYCRRLEIGKEEMIGVVGKVVEDFDFEGFIKVCGEFWKVVFKDGSLIKVGEKVRVVGMDGLMFIVEKVDEKEV